MSETVLIALITGGVTLACNLLSNWSARKKEGIERAIRDQEFTDRLDILEKKVDEHNYWGEKFDDTVTALKVIQKDVEWLKKTGWK